MWLWIVNWNTFIVKQYSIKVTQQIQIIKTICRLLVYLLQGKLSCWSSSYIYRVFLILRILLATICDHLLIIFWISVWKYCQCGVTGQIEISGHLKSYYFSLLVVWDISVKGSNCECNYFGWQKCHFNKGWMSKIKSFNANCFPMSANMGMNTVNSNN